MVTHESECVVLKRRGAEYVAQMLSDKSREEEVEFWSKRTERLRLSHNKALHPTATVATAPSASGEC
jgi:hypothetical protein